jgi:GAF domain-containing protein
MPSQFADLQQLHQSVKTEMDVTLFTVLGITHRGRTMTRLYSSHPHDYPVGSTKSIDGDVSPEWVSACLEHQQPYLAVTPTNVARIFADSALIRSLGCAASINAPVVEDGVTLGVLNILGPENAYGEREVHTAARLAARSAMAVAKASRELR